MRPSIPPKSGPPSPGFKPRYAAFYRAANAVALRLCRGYFPPHGPLPAASLTVGKGLFAVDSLSSPASRTLPMDAMRLYCLCPAAAKAVAYSARYAKRRRKPAGKMPAARAVLKAAVFYIRRVIRMPRPRGEAERVVIAAARIRIAYYCRYRRAAGMPVRNAGKELRLVRLAPCG